MASRMLRIDSDVVTSLSGMAKRRKRNGSPLAAATSSNVCRYGVNFPPPSGSSPSSIAETTVRTPVLQIARTRAACFTGSASPG